MKNVLILLFALLVTGCATAPQNPFEDYPKPNQYDIEMMKEQCRSSFAKRWFANQEFVASAGYTKEISELKIEKQDFVSAEETIKTMEKVIDHIEDNYTMDETEKMLLKRQINGAIGKIRTDNIDPEIMHNYFMDYFLIQQIKEKVNYMKKLKAYKQEKALFMKKLESYIQTVEPDYSCEADGKAYMKID